jgi:hypothetical protein
MYQQRPGMVLSSEVETTFFGYPGMKRRHTHPLRHVSISAGGCVMPAVVDDGRSGGGDDDDDVDDVDDDLNPSPLVKRNQSSGRHSTDHLAAISHGAKRETVTALSLAICAQLYGRPGRDGPFHRTCRLHEMEANRMAVSSSATEQQQKGQIGRLLSVKAVTVDGRFEFRPIGLVETNASTR